MTIYTITQEVLDKNKTWRWPGVSGPGQYTWHEANHSFHPVVQSEQLHDFDSGFGIGGLGRHEEMPAIPTVAQIERMERLEEKAKTCRRCGQSDTFDGAMFTTGGGNICDDCYG